MNFRNKLEEIQFKCKILGQGNPQVVKILKRLALGMIKEDEADRILSVLLAKNGYTFYDPPKFYVGPVASVNSGVMIGRIVRGDRVGEEIRIPIDSYFSGTTLIVGQTQTGKSTAAMIQAIDILHNHPDVVIWVFDVEGQWQGLVNYVPGLLVITPDTDAENFLEPQSAYLKILDLMREDMFLRDGSINLARKIGGRLYKSNDQPTIEDFLAELERMEYKIGTRHAQYVETLLNRISSLSDNLPCLQWQKGFPYEELSRRSVVWLMGGLPTDIAHFYVCLKLVKLALFLEQNELPDRKRIIVVLEESHAFVHPSLRERADLGPPLMETMVRRLAKRGIEFVFIDQIPALLPVSVRGNTNNVLILRLTDDLSVKAMQKRIGLSDEQAKEVPLLTFRRALFQNINYPEPVEIELPEFRPELMSVKQALERTASMLGALPRTPINSSVNPTEIALVEEKKQKRSISFEDSHKLLLDHVSKNPFASLRERAEDIGWSVWFMSRILKELEQMGLVQSFWVGTGQRGSMRRHSKLSQRACEFLQIPPESVRPKGKGSDEHVHLQNMLALKLAKEDRVVKVEMSIGGKSADLGELVRIDSSGDPSNEAEMSKNVIYKAWELELDIDGHTLTNIQQDIAVGFGQVTVVVKNLSVLNQIRSKVYEELPGEDLDKVDFKLIKELLK